MTGMSALRSACRQRDGRLAQSLRARGAHEVGVQRVEHRRARHAREKRDRSHAERERGQHEKAQTAVARRRQPVQRDREQQDEQQSDPIHRETRCRDTRCRARSDRRMPPGLRALSTPSVRPRIVASSIAAPASCSVLGKRSRMSWVIGRLVMYELPRSPRSDVADVVDEARRKRIVEPQLRAQPRDRPLSARSPTIASTGSPGAT